MKKLQGRNRASWFAVVLAGVLAWLASRAGSFLIIDAPRRCDVIVVLAGETERRPERALQLLSEGYGLRMLLDVPTNSKIYEFTPLQLAEKYVHDLPQAASISLCPIDGLSTKDESKNVEKCLAGQSGNRVLIVTSDFHTRRALSIFRREMPGREYSAAASRNDEQFGARWWTHRQWAKTFFDEWLRLLWWEMVEQWR